MFGKKKSDEKKENVLGMFSKVFSKEDGASEPGENKQDIARRALSEVDKENALKVRDGKILITDLKQLGRFLKAIDEGTFKKHVHDDVNDFSSWVTKVVGDVRLGKNLKKMEESLAMSNLINDRVKELEPYLGEKDDGEWEKKEEDLAKKAVVERAKKEVERVEGGVDENLEEVKKSVEDKKVPESKGAIKGEVEKVVVRPEDFANVGHVGGDDEKMEEVLLDESVLEEKAEREKKKAEEDRKKEEIRKKKLAKAEKEKAEKEKDLQVKRGLEAEKKKSEDGDEEAEKKKAEIEEEEKKKAEDKAIEDSFKTEPQEELSEEERMKKFQEEEAAEEIAREEEFKKEEEEDRKEEERLEMEAEGVLDVGEDSSEEENGEDKEKKEGGGEKKKEESEGGKEAGEDKTKEEGEKESGEEVEAKTEEKTGGEKSEEEEKVEKKPKDEEDKNSEDKTQEGEGKVSEKKVEEKNSKGEEKEGSKKEGEEEEGEKKPEEEGGGKEEPEEKEEEEESGEDEKKDEDRVKDDVKEEDKKEEEDKEDVVEEEKKEVDDKEASSKEEKSEEKPEEKEEEGKAKEEDSKDKEEGGDKTEGDSKKDKPEAQKSVADLLAEEGVVATEAEDEGESEDDKKKSSSDEVSELFMAIEKINGKLEMVDQFRKSEDERVNSLSERIGELRQMILDKERDFNEVQTGFEKIDGIVGDINPAEIKKNMEKASIELEKRDVKIEKLETQMEMQGTTIDGYKERMEKIKDFETLLKLLGTIREEVTKIENSQKFSEQLAAKSERVFVELNEKVSMFREKAAKVDGIDELSKELLLTVDEIKNKQDTLVSSDDFDVLKSQVKSISGEGGDSTKKMLKSLEGEVVKMSGRLRSLESGTKGVNELIKEKANLRELIGGVTRDYKGEKLSKDAYMDSVAGFEKRISEIDIILKRFDKNALYSQMSRVSLVVNELVSRMKSLSPISEVAKINEEIKKMEYQIGASHITQAFENLEEAKGDLLARASANEEAIQDIGLQVSELKEKVSKGEEIKPVKMGFEKDISVNLPETRKLKNSISNIQNKLKKNVSRGESKGKKK